MRFRATVACERPAAPAWSDSFGHTVGEDRSAVTFDAAYVPPGSQAGSRIVDGILRETTITKPTLFIDRRDSNAAALAEGAIRSGDEVTVAGVPWQVDGEPARYTHPRTGRQMPLVVELRKADG